MAIHRLVMTLCVVTAAVTPLGAQNLSTTTSITDRDVRAHVDFLASDLLGGRDSGRPGSEIAAQYIAAHFQRLGLQQVVDGWQMPFDLPGAAGRGTAVIQAGGQAFEGSAVLAVPRFSGTGSVTAKLAFEGDDFDGRIAVLDTDESGDRGDAAAAIEAGAVAVLFLSAEEVFPRPDDGDMRRMGGPGSPFAGGPSGMSDARGLDDLPAGLKEQILDQLEAMGLDAGSVQMDFRVGGPDDLPEGLPSGPPTSGMTFTMGGPGSFSRARALAAPAVTVATPLQTALLDAMEAGEPVTLEVRRQGQNQSSNVLALVEGSDPVLKDEYVVIGAHYDHVGQDQHGNVWNGADDNASGTAGLLEIAEALAEMRVKPKRSIVLAAWGAEERGLVGSNAFARTPPVPMDRIAAYLNLDMIGRNDPGTIEVLSASAALKDLAFHHAGNHGLKPEEGQAFFLNASDTAAFVQEEVPTLFYFANTHEDYHKASDDPHRLDTDKASRVARAAFGVLVETANSDQRPDFKKAGGGGLSGMFMGPPRGRRLGVFESPGASETGFLVGGVTDGGVGANAGLEADDLILRVGDQAIANSTDLREALEAQEAGAPFDIEVKRDGSAVVLQGVFQDG